MTERRWWNTLVGFGGLHLVLGGWAAVDASSFATWVAPFGPANAHLIHDFAACAITFGLGLLVAARVRRWRTPALTLTAIWTGAHGIAHVADVADAHPAFVGPIEAALLVAASVLYAALALLNSRGEAHGHCG